MGNITRNGFDPSGDSVKVAFSPRTDSVVARLRLAMAGVLCAVLVTASGASAAPSQQPTPSNLRITPGAGSLSVRWGVTNRAELAGFRLRVRAVPSSVLQEGTTLQPITMPWNAPIELPARARRYMITGLSQQPYEVRIRALATGGGGGTVKGIATPLAPEAEETEEAPEEEPPHEEEPPKEEPPKEEEPPHEEEPPQEEETPTGDCTSTISSISQANAALTPDSVVCLTAGTYGAASISARPSSEATLTAAPGAHVVVGGVNIASGTSNFTIRDLTVKGGIVMGSGNSNITIDHNDISSGGEGIVNSSVNCSSPNAPRYAGCTSTAPDTYITISANKIHGYGEGGGEDAIHLSNWEHVRITANELYNLEEHGNHTDAFQSVFGGSNLTFDHNYEHDNQSQGFFIKDGDASNVTVNDNLFLRNDNLGEGENNIQVFNTAGFVMTKNTVWDGQGDLIRAEGAAEPLTATVNHNVEQVFNSIHEGSGPAYTLNENSDVFKEAPWTIAKGALSIVLPSPSFRDPADDDYRLSPNPNNIGVDWAPSEYTYGPDGG
jgi:hypothetical protein